MAHADFLLAHLSDPHLFAPRAISPSMLLDKRSLGVVNALGRRRAVHRPEVLRATLDALLAHGPDHLVVTGDLSTVGAEAELLAFRAILEERDLGPDRVTVIPGNHDAYVPAVVRSGAFERVFGAFCAEDREPAPCDAPVRTWPRLRLRGPVALVACTSARPSGPLLALGTLGSGQRARLDALLADPALAGHARIVALHHPVQPGAGHWHNRLTDAPEVRRILATRGATLVLHGHLHRFLRASLPGPAPDLPIPVVGAPSASAALRDAGRRGGGVLYRIRDGHLAQVTRVSGD